MKKTGKPRTRLSHCYYCWRQRDVPLYVLESRDIRSVQESKVVVVLHCHRLEDLLRVARGASATSHRFRQTGLIVVSVAADHGCGSRLDSSAAVSGVSTHQSISVLRQWALGERRGDDETPVADAARTHLDAFVSYKAVVQLLDPGVGDTHVRSPLISRDSATPRLARLSLLASR